MLSMHPTYGTRHGSCVGRRGLYDISATYDPSHRMPDQSPWTWSASGQTFSLLCVQATGQPCGWPTSTGVPWPCAAGMLCACIWHVRCPCIPLMSPKCLPPCGCLPAAHNAALHVAMWLTVPWCNSCWPAAVYFGFVLFLEAGWPQWLYSTAVYRLQKATQGVQRNSQNGEGDAASPEAQGLLQSDIEKGTAVTEDADVRRERLALQNGETWVLTPGHHHMGPRQRGNGGLACLSCSEPGSQAARVCTRGKGLMLACGRFQHV